LTPTRASVSDVAKILFPVFTEYAESSDGETFVRTATANPPANTRPPAAHLGGVMPLFRFAQLCACLAIVAGCQTVDPHRASTVKMVEPSLATSTDEPAPPVDLAAPSLGSAPERSAITVSYQEETLPASGPNLASSGATSSAAQPAELSLSWLIEEVQARNPSLQAMAAAWQAAAARYPQAISLEDPMFMAMAAPASFGSDEVESAYALQLNQKFPWFGKRAARGQRASAEANAALHDLEDSRLQLNQIVQTAFYDYYLARRGLELNRENMAVMERFRSTAQAKYRANQVTQQDELQAAVELAELERQNIELERMDKVAAARISTLLRASPFAPLPPPPAKLETPTGQLDGQALMLLAEGQRPDIAALAAKVRAEEAAVTLACKDYYPDVDVFGRYDTFWQPADTQSDLRPQVGATINVPIYKNRLDAAVREAVSRLNKQRAEYEQRLQDVDYEVANTSALVEESRRTVAIYADKLIPAAQQNIAAATANYDVAKVSFLELAAAQRQSIELRRKQEESLAAYHTRLAELTRAVGGSLPTEAKQKTVNQSPPSD
jgi:outer membrane protein TolC